MTAVNTGLLAKNQYQMWQLEILERGIDSPLTKMCVEVLSEIFKRKRKKLLVKIGTYSIDIVGGMFDPSGITGAATTAARTAFAAIEFILFSKAAHEINDILNGPDTKKIDHTLLNKMPVLGCYVLQELTDAEMYGIPKYHLDELKANDPGEYQRVTDGSKAELYARGKNSITTYKKEFIEPLRSLAMGRAMAAPYLLLYQGGRKPVGYTKTDRITGVWF